MNYLWFPSLEDHMLQISHNQRLWPNTEMYVHVHQVAEAEQEVKPMRDQITAEEMSTVKYDQKVEEWEVTEYHLEFQWSSFLYC